MCHVAVSTDIDVAVTMHQQLLQQLAVALDGVLHILLGLPGLPGVAHHQVVQAPQLLSLLELLTASTTLL